GLDTAMRSIIKGILASPVPVAGYVAPQGARAASAGTFILYASHIAAMAPATNLGAATPIAIGIGDDSPRATRDKDTKSNDKTQPSHRESMRAKQINDAAAYIRGLAQMRGRNADWAERAVREAVSLSADEALKLRVGEYITADVPALIAQLDGKKMNVLGQDKQLLTKGALVVDAQPDWRARL